MTCYSIIWLWIFFKLDIYESNFKLLKIVDGYTVDVIIDLGFDVSVKKRVRLVGINALTLFTAVLPALKKEKKKSKKVLPET